MIRTTVVCASLAILKLMAADTVCAQRSEQEESVKVAYKKMEEADRNGDGELWFALRDKKTLRSLPAAVKDAMRKGGRPRPTVKYEPLTVRVLNDHAVLLGKVTDSATGATQYQSVFFSVEGGAWKVSREQWSETPFDQFVLYGLLPPESGSFSRSLTAWKRAPYALINTDVVGKREVMWKMQATYDESFLYVRYEWITDIPLPGSRVSAELASTGKTGGPPAPPAMQINIHGVGPSATFSVT